ncbi:MAG: hypothetical protein OEZ59_01045 [Deltaproteobacteria bacterium]|nr:hypothetical protein [Deltaproteobacteria bacterium]
MKLLKASLLLLVLLLAVQVSAQAGKNSELKKLMGDNFQNLHMILQNLITSNYQNLPEEAAIIEDHAINLLKDIPSSISTDEQRSRYETYANMLRMRARNMFEMGTELKKRDKNPIEEGKMNIEYLRVVMAEDFGKVITTCVLCHNQFRRRKL